MTRTRQYIKSFFKLEASGGILLIIASIIAIILANSAGADAYHAFLNTKFTISFGTFGLSKDLILWINDGLMAIFFFLVGMEIKREVLEGELSSVSQALLPCIAAVGGVALPAIIYTMFNGDHPDAAHGWAIPAATDIAFALGVLALLGSRVPLALKVFLMAVAVIDDLMAIIIIAVFYTDNLALGSLIVAGGAMLLLFILNVRGVRRVSPYVVVGIIMWVAVLKSGVHATIAGVVLGLFIPLRTKDEHGESLLKTLEHNLHGWVAYAILPIFAFANAGITFKGLSPENMLDPVPLGIAAGLFVGKQVGIFTTAGLLIFFKLARLPAGSNWVQFYAVCVLCGIGFTMSLFVSGLAFDSAFLRDESKIGIMVGSLLSGVCGYVLMRVTTKPNKKQGAA